jgi:hypothetical protein
MATQSLHATAKAGEAPVPASATALAPPTLLGRVSVAVDSGLRRVFEALGLFVAARPWTVIITTFIVAGLLTLGMLNQTVQNNDEKLWAPQSSIAAKDRCCTVLARCFGSQFRLSLRVPPGPCWRRVGRPRRFLAACRQPLAHRALQVFPGGATTRPTLHSRWLCSLPPPFPHCAPSCSDCQ